VPAYSNHSISEFLKLSKQEILGELLSKYSSVGRFRTLERDAAESWKQEIEDLRVALHYVATELPEAIGWTVLLEFPVPRRLKRIDVVILAKDSIFVLEFKQGAATSDAFWQVWDYALDLADCHVPSRGRQIVPIVVAAAEASNWHHRLDQGGRVQYPLSTTPAGLGRKLLDQYELLHDPKQLAIDIKDWDNGLYMPVPTIVEAAIAIFAGMEVREITHSQAGAENLTTAAASLVQAVSEAFSSGQKLICFLTGIPGAGKTLAGLRTVHDPRIATLTGSDPHFMSGNGPLVKVLQEAITRFYLTQGKKRQEISRKVSVLIQNVHVMAREHWDDPLARPPNDRIIVFDEAQRAWNAEKNRKKFGRDVSEPEMLLSIMDRHQGWAVIICIIGGGQEIHSGEAGLEEWGRALSKFPSWKILASPEAISGGPVVAGSRLTAGIDINGRIELSTDLHLKVPTRSYRAKRLAEWTHYLLKGDLKEARKVAEDGELIYVTRDLNTMKEWLRRHKEGSARTGLVACSSASRLRAYGIETSTDFHRAYPYEHWFLNGPEDIRSSFQLEVVATEFEIQGLELDLVGLCWGSDIVWQNGWKARNLRFTRWSLTKGSRATWVVEKNPEKIAFAINAYRVLLTRSRQKTIVWVPKGESGDPSLNPAELDWTADALIRAGAVVV